MEMGGRMREFDVIVVGGGLSGGLPAAAYLQRAGAEVAVVERGIDCGRFYLSYELFPGLLFDHSPVNFSGLSPVVRDLELGDLGYRLAPTEIAYSTIDRGGRTLTVHADGARTVAEIERYSRVDAATWAELGGRLNEAAPDLLRLVFYTAHPDPGRLDEAVELTAAVLDVDRSELQALSAPDLVARLFENDFVRRTVMALPALNLFGDLLVPGQGALSWAWALLMRASVAPAGNQALVQALEQAFLRAGGTLLRDTSATQLVVEDGACRGVTVRRGGRSETLRARQAVISNVGASLTHELLPAGAEGLRSDEQRLFVRGLADWQSQRRTIAIHDIVLSRPFHWPAAQELLGRSPRVYLLWDSFEDCRDWLERCRGDDEDVYFDDIEVTQYHAIYPSSRPDLFALRVRYGTGPYLDERDDGRWEARRERFASRMLALLAEFDPDLAGAVVYEHLTTPLELWRSNPAARHGNPVGGDLVAEQWIGGRLPYRTPIDGLYCSNSVWPPGLSLMGSGYNAACVVADDLGIPRPSWWRHSPGGAMVGEAPAG
jgi:beta-carotene ketolase (CrtO type)